MQVYVEMFSVKLTKFQYALAYSYIHAARLSYNRHIGAISMLATVSY